MNLRKKVIMTVSVAAIVSTGSAQTLSNDLIQEDLINRTDSVLSTCVDSLLSQYPSRRYDVIPSYMLRPAVFDNYRMFEPIALKPNTHGDVSPEVYRWLDDYESNEEIVQRAKQYYMVNYPQEIRYNESLLPEPPKKFRAKVDPELAKIVITEIPVSEQELVADVTPEIKRRNWLHDFNGALQFSQAYVSPNWYQGGTNSLNILLNLNLDIKLNPAFHPNLLFENNFSYKLSLNSAPEDELRSYSISEDLFQINSKLGYKAAKHWYYSLTGQFKTQLLNNYKSNTMIPTAAILSPGELNLGLGMTYNYTSPSKRFVFDLAISPLSYNLKTCIHTGMDVTAFGIKEGRHTVSDFGSSAEAKITWNIARNVKWQSRLFMFTNYHYAQGDWENTFEFTVSRFLSTRIYVHLRYDSSDGASADEHWHDWQLKEILSFGFSYIFSSYK
ncbi:MAG: DUF3078 domain-containing protein [Muribaculaceae bacterium]|nr:DUF3078 domain-containing protein [Muribaculaceae bacterium]